MIPRRLFLLSLALWLAPIVLRAADPETASPGATAPGGHRAGAGGRMNPADRLKTMKEKLSLTDEQAEKIKAIFHKNREKLTGVKDLKPEERRAKMREAFKSEMEEVAAVLTPAQKEKWKEEMKKHRSEGSRKAGRRAGAAAAKA